MNESVDTLAPERKLSATTLAVLAFVMGTLFALLPMYYVYTSRDAATPATAHSGTSLTSTTDAASRDSTRDGPLRFAARLTYELSHTPTEPPPSPVRVAAKPEPRPAAAVAAPVREPSRDPAQRIQNARPIIATPPEPRDTTREMEREARRPEYREPPRIAQAQVEPVQPRVVEGRDFVVPTKPVTTRPIAAPEPEPAKRITEPAPRIAVATPTVVTGASPIGAPPEAKAEAQKAKAEPQKGKAEPQNAKADTPPATADALGSRLSATREWLAGAPQTTHTIQLMGGSEEQLKSQLKILGKLVEPSKIYVFRTVAQGKPSMTVLYGAYADRKAALQALEKLPAPIVANKPVLRTVNGIRAEQKQHGIDF